MSIEDALENREKAKEFATTSIDIDSDSQQIESWSSGKSVKSDEDYKSDLLKPYIVLAAANSSSEVPYKPEKVDDMTSEEVLNSHVLNNVYTALENYEKEYAESFQELRELPPVESRRKLTRRHSEIEPDSDHETTADKTGTLGD